MGTASGEGGISATVYADDSGNTGPHLLDDKQPVGVTAMLVVDAAKEDEMRQRCEALFRPGAQRPKELKYIDLAKRTRGGRIVAKAMEVLDAAGADVFFSVTEKRYLAAALFGETFLDPLLIDDLPAQFATREVRTMAANLVHAVAGADLLSAFLSAFHERDATSLSHVAKRIASLLQFHPTPEAPQLAMVISTAADRPHVPATFDELPSALRPAPHTFNFMSLLSAVDHRMREAGRVGKLVADSDLKFGPVLDFAFKLGQEADLFPSPYSEHISVLTNIVSRSEADSHAVIGVQLADLCAGLIAAVVRAAQIDTSINAVDELPGWAQLLQILLKCAPSSYWQVSERLLRRMTRTFAGLLPAAEPGSSLW